MSGYCHKEERPSIAPPLPPWWWWEGVDNARWWPPPWADRCAVTTLVNGQSRGPGWTLAGPLWLPRSLVLQCTGGNQECPSLQLHGNGNDGGEGLNCCLDANWGARERGKADKILKCGKFFKLLEQGKWKLRGLIHPHFFICNVLSKSSPWLN